MRTIEIPDGKRLFLWIDVNDESHLVMADSFEHAKHLVIRSQVEANLEHLDLQGLEAPSYDEAWSDAEDHFERNDEIHTIDHLQPIRD